MSWLIAILLGFGFGSFLENQSDTANILVYIILSVVCLALLLSIIKSYLLMRNNKYERKLNKQNYKRNKKEDKDGK